MKKNTKSVAALKRQVAAKNQVIENLKKKKLSNTLSDEVVAEAEALIEEKEAEVDFVEAEIERLENSEENRDGEMKAIIDELKEEVTIIRDSLKGPKSIVKMKNFIESKDALKAFREVVQNSTNSKDFKRNWNEVLVKNGITPADVMLPPLIIAEINDAWENTAEGFLSLLDVTGLNGLKVLSENSDGSLTTPDLSRAHGHKKGDEKVEQELAFTPKEIRAQYIYKYITIDRETVDYEDENGILMRYVARELMSRVIHEIMRAVLIGDGRTAGTQGKIDKFEAITAAGVNYTATVVAAGADPTIDEVVQAINQIEADGAIVVFMSKQTAASLRRYVYASGGSPSYISMDDLASVLGVSEVRTTRLLDSTAAGAPRVIAFVGKAYKVVGDLTMRNYDNFILSYNKMEYLTEVYAGGALGVLHSAAVVINPAA